MRGRLRAAESLIIYRVCPGITGRPRPRQATGAAGAEQQRSADHFLTHRQRSTTPTRLRCTAMAKTSGHRGSPSTTLRPRAMRRSMPTPRRRRPAATRFKRPENGVFQPSDGFRDFFFTETGDTDATSVETTPPVAGDRCSSLVTQSSPSANTGRIRVFYKGDRATPVSTTSASFRQRSWASSRTLATYCTHNGTRSTLVTRGTSRRTTHPVRCPRGWLAEGRDASATINSSFGGFGKNDSDNEITGLHISNGDPSVQGILGTAKPNFGNGAADNGNNGKATWRSVYTQQHGDNVTYEVLPVGR